MSFYDKFSSLDIPALQNGVRLPEFKPSEEQYAAAKVPNTTNSKDFIRELCRIGFKEKVVKTIPKEQHKIYIDRIKEELDVIEQLGFIDYILMVWDICDFCAKSGIPTGPGRGSVSSSLICYLIGVTKVDSIKYGTFFTRFLSKSRAKYKMVDGIKYIDGSLAPDIDQDIDFLRRQEVIDYLQIKYPNRTCKLLTTQTLSSKILIKEVLKKYEEANEEQANFASGLMEKIHGIPQEIKDALSEDKEKENEKFKEWAKDHKETVEIALKLSGLQKSMGIHASALAISFDPIGTLMPMQLTSPDAETKEMQVVTAYDMYSAQEICLKFDLLGLKTVSLIDDACKQLGIKADSIDINDPSIYAFLQGNRGFHGIFQFESHAQGEVGRKIKPQKFKHIVDALAISRPGASSFLSQYLDYVHRDIYKPINPVIDATLKETGAIALFQEQTLQMLNNLGLTLDECEKIRKIIGKKEKDKVEDCKKQIYEACEINNHPKEVADLVFKVVSDSAGYSFSLCLSPDTRVTALNGYKKMSEMKVGDYILAHKVKDWTDHYVKIKNIFKSREVLYRVKLKWGVEIECSMNHKILCLDLVMRPLKDIVAEKHRILTRWGFNEIDGFEELGVKDSLDFEVDHEDHNFYANNIAVSNCHSVAYSMITAQTAYLKANHPKEFFLACLHIAKEDSKKIEKIGIISSEMAEYGLKMLPPDLAVSDLDFKIENEGIRYGLSFIKGVSDKTIQKLQKFRSDKKANKFEVFQSMNQAGLNVGVGSALIQAGCMTEFSKSRSRLVLELQTWNVLTPGEKKLAMSLGEKFNFDLLTLLLFLSKNNNEKGKLYIKESRFETFKRKYDQYKKIYVQNSKNESFANWFYERTVLGFSYSSTLKSVFDGHVYNLRNLADIKSDVPDIRVTGIAVVKKCYVSKSKAGNAYAKIDLEDETAEYSSKIFSGKLQLCKEANDGLPDEEDIVIFKGTTKEGCLFLDECVVQNSKIYMRLRDVKEDVEI